MTNHKLPSLGIAVLFYFLCATGVSAAPPPPANNGNGNNGLQAQIDALQAQVDALEPDTSAATECSGDEVLLGDGSCLSLGTITDRLDQQQAALEGLCDHIAAPLPSFCPVVLARAYIDADPNDGGYNVAIDPNIAIVYDSDATPGLSIGDTVRLGVYPLSFDPCLAPWLCKTGFSSLSNKDIVITEVIRNNPYFGDLRVGFDGGNGYIQFIYDDFRINFLLTHDYGRGDRHVLDLVDSHDQAQDDSMECLSSKVATCSHPIPYTESQSDFRDDPWLDVEIY
jgi:hypothetical protein